MKRNSKECSDNVELISLLASGCASNEELTAVERHVAQCCECAARLHEMQLLIQGLQRAAKSEDTIDAAKMSNRVLASVRTPAEPVAHTNGLNSFRTGLILVALAASVLIVFGVWKSIYQREELGIAAHLDLPIQGEKPSGFKLDGPPRWRDWNRALATSDEALEVLFAYDAGGLASYASDQSSLLLELGKR